MRHLLCLLASASLVHAQEPPKSEEVAAYEAWAREMVDAVRRGDNARTMVLLDLQALLEVSTKGGPEDLRKKFAAEMMEAQKLRGGMLHEIVRHAQGGGHFDLLRVTTRDGAPCARFRVASHDLDVNYIDLKLRRDADGTVRGIDMYNHQNGEWVSRSMRKFFLPYVRDQRRSAWEKLVEGEDDWVAGVKSFEKIMALERAGHPDQALELYEGLPEAVRQQKECMALGIRLASQVDEKKFHAAVRDYLTRFPDDPSVLLVALASHRMAGRYDEALAAVDALDKAIGGDPYLDVVRAEALMCAGKLDEARQKALAAAKSGPDWGDACFLLLDIELRTKRFKEVAGLLTILEDRFGYDFSAMDGIPDFAEFMKSEEYRAWLKRKKGD